MAVSNAHSSGAQSENRTFSILVENRFGILSRIAGLFSARGYNIESLTVSRINDPTLSRITMVVQCDTELSGQIIKQIKKLVEVVDVADLTHTDCVDRELVLVRVRALEERRATLLNEAAIFRARVVTATPDAYVFEVTGDTAKIDAFLDVVKAFGIDDMVRTGKISLPRSGQASGTGDGGVASDLTANSWTAGE